MKKLLGVSKVVSPPPVYFHHIGFHPYWYTLYFSSPLLPVSGKGSAQFCWWKILCPTSREWGLRIRENKSINTEYPGFDFNFKSTYKFSIISLELSVHGLKIFPIWYLLQAQKTRDLFLKNCMTAWNLYFCNVQYTENLKRNCMCAWQLVLMQCALN